MSQGLLLIESRDTRQLPEVLSKVRGGLAVVPVSTDKQTTSWTKLRLNENHTYFDAIRFVSPLNERANLFFAIACPLDSAPESWEIVASSGFARIDYRRYRKHVVLSDLDLPDENVLILNLTAVSEIAPGVEHYVHFQFATEEPVELYVKMKADTRTWKGTLSDDETAAWLDITPSPLQRNAAALPEEIVSDMVEKGKYNEALSTIRLFFLQARRRKPR